MCDGHNLSGTVSIESRQNMPKQLSPWHR